MTHELKLSSKFFKDTLHLRKRFEYRFNDRDFKEGDTIKLFEWDSNLLTYTGCYVIAIVDYVLYDVDFNEVSDGFCIMSITCIETFVPEHLAAIY